MENTNPNNLLTEAGIMQAGLQTLREHGLDAQIEPVPAEQIRGDALVRIGFGGQVGKTFIAECKRWVTPKTLGAVAARLRELGPTALLITDYATPTVADQLVVMDIAFADAAGNAYLRGPNFLIRTAGRKPRHDLKAPRAGRAWQPTGLKVIFALLCNPDWINLGYRDLAVRAGVANGTVGWVMRELAEQGFVIKGRRRKLGRRLTQRRGLLDRWVEYYAGTLRQTTLLGRYATDDIGWWKTLDTTKYNVLLGGETAGAILTEYIKPGIVTLYGAEIPRQLMGDQRLRLARDGNVEIRRRFWTFDYEWNHQNVTPPALVYADLLATGDDRCRETAQKVYDAHLAGFVAAG